MGGRNPIIRIMDLTLVDTEALLYELHKRFDHGIFYGMQIRTTGKSDPHNVECYRYWGDERVCQGLAADMVCQINKTFKVEEITSEEL